MEMLRHRGSGVSYHPGRENRCPGCGRSHWLIGRLLAECAFCATALPLASRAPAAPLFVGERQVA